MRPWWPASTWSIVALALIVTTCSSGCRTRYDPSRCPESPFPAARFFLDRPGFEALRFFRGVTPQDPHREVETEIWSDARFAYQASLHYEYAKTRPECPQAVRIVLQYPLSVERIGLGGEFLSVFERHLGVPLEAPRAALRPGELPPVLPAPIVSDAGRAVAETVSIRTANRGDVLMLSIVERSADERGQARSGAAPERPRIGDAGGGATAPR